MNQTSEKKSFCTKYLRSTICDGIKPLLIVLLLSFAVDSFGQKDKKYKRPKAIHWSELTDSLAFQNGPIPLVQAYGYYSDSLSQVHGGIFYTLGSEYFQIQTAADYYLWFTRRYDFLFRSNIETYELFYVAGDQLSMATFISENYKGKRYPIKMSLSIPSNWLSRKNPKSEKMESRRQQKAYDKNVSDPVKLSRPQKKN